MTAVLLAAALAVQQPDLRDAESVTRLLASLRAADPAVCELAGRTLTNHWGWMGDAGDEPMPAPMPMPMPAPMPMPFAGRGPGISGPNVSYRAGHGARAQVLAAFRTALRDQSRCVRRIAARMVAREQPTWASTEFGAMAKDADAGLRETGMLGLGELEDPRTIGAMTSGLGDRDVAVRAMAAWALGQLRNSKRSPLWGRPSATTRRSSAGEPPGRWARSKTRRRWRRSSGRSATATPRCGARRRGPWARSRAPRPCRCCGRCWRCRLGHPAHGDLGAGRDRGRLRRWRYWPRS